jgi:hypothetical protein
MPHHGRKSTASLSVVADIRQQRAPAPAHLSDDERAEWKALTGCMPTDWFPRESHAALAALCRHSVRSRVLGAQVNKIEAKCLQTEEGIRVLDKLLAMLERETRCVAALSRSMRLTQQTRVDKRIAGSRAGVPAASFYQTMSDEDDDHDD